MISRIHTYLVKLGKFEQKLFKTTSVNKNENQFSLAYNKETQPSLGSQTTISPIYQVLYQLTNKEEMQVVEGEDSLSQEQQLPEARTYQI